MTVVNDLNMRVSGHETLAPAVGTAVLDRAHLGDIHGALGSIAKDDVAPRALGPGSTPSG